MKKKFLIVLISVLSLFLVFGIVLTIILLNRNSLTLEMDDVTVEFDGNNHHMNAKSNFDGSFYYTYNGIDNEYYSQQAPVEAGEYLVVANFKSFDSKKQGDVEAKLIITLPFELNENGNNIVSYLGDKKDIVLPSKYKNKTINEISDNVFKGKNINSIKLPESVFYFNPNSIIDSNIEKLYISKNSKLKDGFYPSNLNIEFYDDVYTLYDDTFGSIIGIDELVLPKSLTSISIDALSKIEINKLTLYSNLHLSGLNLSNSIKYVHVLNKDNELAESFFKECMYIETIELDEGISILNDMCFYDCISLNTLIIKSHIDKIEGNCFNSDFILERIVLGDGFTLDKLSLKQINVVEITCDILKHDFYNSKTIKKAILPDTMIELKFNAFSDCDNLEEVQLPKNLEVIGHTAFYNCKNLKRIILPDSVREIGYSAFNGCKNLIEVKLPNNLKEIREGAFAFCFSLEEIDIPDSVVKICYGAFQDCRNLKFVSLSSNLEYIGGCAFADCQMIESIAIGSKVNNIGYRAFEYCYSLKSITIYSDNIPEQCELDRFHFEQYSEELKNKLQMNEYFTSIPYECVIYVKLILLEKYKNKFPNLNFKEIEE